MAVSSLQKEGTRSEEEEKGKRKQSPKKEKEENDMKEKGGKNLYKNELQGQEVTGRVRWTKELL